MLDINTFLDAVLQLHTYLTPELRKHLRLEITPTLHKDLCAYIQGDQIQTVGSFGLPDSIYGIELIIRDE